MTVGYCTGCHKSEGSPVSLTPWLGSLQCECTHSRALSLSLSPCPTPPPLPPLSPSSLSLTSLTSLTSLYDLSSTLASEMPHSYMLTQGFQGVRLMKESWGKLYCVLSPHLRSYGVTSTAVIDRLDLSGGNVGPTS